MWPSKCEGTDISTSTLTIPETDPDLIPSSIEYAKAVLRVMKSVMVDLLPIYLETADAENNHTRFGITLRFRKQLYEDLARVYMEKAHALEEEIGGGYQAVTVDDLCSWATALPSSQRETLAETYPIFAEFEDKQRHLRQIERKQNANGYPDDKAQQSKTVDTN